MDTEASEVRRIFHREGRSRVQASCFPPPSAFVSILLPLILDSVLSFLSVFPHTLLQSVSYYSELLLVTTSLQPSLDVGAHSYT